MDKDNATKVEEEAPADHTVITMNALTAESKDIVLEPVLTDNPETQPKLQIDWRRRQGRARNIRTQ